jgi:hypothetical protein
MAINVHKITNVPVFHMAIGLNDVGGGKSINTWAIGRGVLNGSTGTRFTRCHFRAQKSLDFQRQLLPMAPVMDLPASKSLHSIPYKQHVH